MKGLNCTYVLDHLELGVSNCLWSAWGAPGVSLLKYFPRWRKVFHIKRTECFHLVLHPLTHLPAKSLELSGAEPRIMGDLLYQRFCCESTGLIFSLFFNPSFIILITLNIYEFKYIHYNTYTAEVKLEMYYYILLTYTSQKAYVWTRQRSHRTLSRWWNSIVSALSPPETWDTPYGQMKHEIADTFKLYLYCETLCFWRRNHTNLSFEKH